MKKTTEVALKQLGEFGERIEAEVLNHLNPPLLRCVFKNICLGFNNVECTREKGIKCKELLFFSPGKVEGYCKICSSDPEINPPVGYNGSRHAVCLSCAVFHGIELYPQPPVYS